MSTARIAALMLLAGLAVPTASRAASLDDQIKAAYSAYDAAFAKQDAKALVAFYTDDAVMLPPTHDVLKGQAAIEKFFTGLLSAGFTGHLSAGFTGHKFELIESSGTGQVVVAAAKWSGQGKDGTAMNGIAAHEFVQQPDGNLKIRLATFN